MQRRDRTEKKEDRLVTIVDTTTLTELHELLNKLTEALTETRNLAAEVRTLHRSITNDPKTPRS